MYKLDIPVDLKESAAIERRRNAELQRQSRIFNSKVRQIGVDLEAIKEQERERRMMEEMERRRGEAFAADMNRQDKIGQMLQARREADARRVNEAVEQFRKVHQTADQRREWDLYDPESLKKDVPARVCDDDPRCTVSTLQKFEGEDLNSKARKKLQQEQLREWAKQQAKEKADAKARENYAEHLHQLKQRELDQRAVDIQNAEDQCRRAIREALADYNKALSDEKAHQAELKKRRDQDDNATEVSNHVYGDMLTENPDVAKSAFGAHRVVPDRWKGMTPEQVEEIKKTQEAQMAENARLKAEAEERQREWDRQALANARAGILLEREQDRLRKDLNRRALDANQQLAAEQKAHLEFLEKEVYTNPPTAAYFMQFNTDSR